MSSKSTSSPMVANEPQKRGCRECNNVVWHKDTCSLNKPNAALPMSPVLDSERAEQETGRCSDCRHDSVCTTQGNQNCIDNHTPQWVDQCGEQDGSGNSHCDCRNSFHAAVVPVSTSEPAKPQCATQDAQTQRQIGAMVMMLLQDDAQGAREIALQLKVEFDTDGPFVRADRVSSQPEWQPIETAPKDGTRILGWRRGQIYPLIVWWDTAAQWWGLHMPPTRWQPLPAPPNSKMENENAMP